MSWILAISILLRFVALAATVWLLIRWRDWRLVFLSVMLLLMISRQVMTLEVSGTLQEVTSDMFRAEMPGLFVSLMALAAMVGLDRIFQANRNLVQRVAHSEQRLRFVLEQVPVVLWATDQDLRITLSMGAALSHFQLKQAEAVGKTVHEFLVKSTNENQHILAHQSALLGNSISYEWDWEGRTYVSHLEPLRNPDGSQAGALGVAADISARKLVEAKLAQAHAELEVRVKERTAELQEEVEMRREIQEALLAQQQVLKQLIDAQEQERRLISCEIHDGLVQFATAALMHMDALQVEHPQLATQFQEVAGLMQNTVQEGRQLINGIHPPMIDELGVLAAIVELVHHHNLHGLDVDFDGPDSLDRLSSLQEIALFRIVQEALNNVKKHSTSPEVCITLRRESESIYLDISDQGQGFDPSQIPSGHFGLRGMHERIRSLGGKLTIESQLGHGTRLEVILPVLNPQEV